MKPLTQTEYVDEVLKTLYDEHGYTEEEFSRKDALLCLKAAAQVTIANAIAEHGCPVIGIGKLRLHKRPSAKSRMGRNPSTGEEIKIKARPAQYVPKFRMSKSCKEACLELVADRNKKLARKFKKR